MSGITAPREMPFRRRFVQPWMGMDSIMGKLASPVPLKGNGGSFSGAAVNKTHCPGLAFKQSVYTNLIGKFRANYRVFIYFNGLA